MVRFEEVIDNPNIINATSRMGFTACTPIQEKVIPLALEGRDIIGQAKTGTGKTAAFGIPLIDRIDPEDSSIQALVLAPTRELVMQVSDEINQLAIYEDLQSVSIFGGQEIQKQIQALKKKPQIIVATPGRLMDHMRRKTIRLDKVRFFVLDEADEMLNMGFIEDIETIMKGLPKSMQIMFFSATMPPKIASLSKRFLKNPETVKVQSKTETVDAIDQFYMEVRESEKLHALRSILDLQNPELCIIFGKTKRRVDELTNALNMLGYHAEGLHGDMRQERRQAILKKFKNNKLSILVATDVAARGLDVSNISHVINFDVPQDVESYIHRIGRTGRAGKTGISYIFFTKRERPFIKSIEKVTKSSMKEQMLPSKKQIENARFEQTIAKLEKGSKDNKYLEQYVDSIEDRDHLKTLLVTAIQQLTKTDVDHQVSLTAEHPREIKKKRSARSHSNYRNKNKKSHYSKGNYGKSKAKSHTKRDNKPQGK